MTIDLTGDSLLFCLSPVYDACAAIGHNCRFCTLLWKTKPFESDATVCNFALLRTHTLRGRDRAPSANL
jgi:hypothetical protein